MSSPAVRGSYARDLAIRRADVDCTHDEAVQVTVGTGHDTPDTPSRRFDGAPDRGLTSAAGAREAIRIPRPARRRATTSARPHTVLVPGRSISHGESTD